MDIDKLGELGEKMLVYRNPNCHTSCSQDDLLLLDRLVFFRRVSDNPFTLSSRLLK